MTKLMRLSVGAAVIAFVFFPTGVRGEVSEQFIVELKDGVDRDTFIRLHGVGPRHRYEILHGFAGRLSAAQRQRLQADPNVASITPDTEVHIMGFRSRARRDRNDDVSAQATVAFPGAQSGVRRIGAPTVWPRFRGNGISVAIIDTGIDCNHPDLRTAFTDGPVRCLSGANTIAGTSTFDDNGHGTHVAGIVAARLQPAGGTGVTGVAPEATLFAVKVLSASGSGFTSDIIQGLDWAAANGMDVANLSLGGFDTLRGNSPLCAAVTRAVNAGVTVVVAAGNSRSDALNFAPANCRFAITVSAFADSNGLPGGGGPALSGGAEQDDSFADTFSNFSRFCYDNNGSGTCTGSTNANLNLHDKFLVDITAPGVDVLSTVPDSVSTDGYESFSGTSMASPHVAGAAALLLDQDPTLTPVQVRVRLRNAGECRVGAAFIVGQGMCRAGTQVGRWPGDNFDNFAEPLVSVDTLGI